MAKIILIQLKAEDLATPQIKALETSIQSLGKTANNSTKQQAKGFALVGDSAKTAGSKTTTSMKKSSGSVRDATGTIESLGNQFRYLSLVVGVTSGLMINAMRGFVGETQRVEEALMGLMIETNKWSRSQDEVMEVVKELSDTGLVTLGESYEVMRNIIASGIPVQKASAFAFAILDRASAGAKQSNMANNEVMVTATGGLKDQREMMFDNVGIQGIFQKAIDSLTKSTGRNSKSFSKQEIALEAVNITIRESTQYAGAHELAQQLLSGSIGRATNSIKEMKVALGDTLKPVVGIFSAIIVKTTGILKKFTESNSDLVGVFMAVSTALTVLIAVIATFGAMLPMVITGLTALKTAMNLTALSTGKFTLILLGSVAALATFAYFALKATNNWDRFKVSVKDITTEFIKMGNTLIKTGESAEELNAKTQKALDDISDKMAKTTRGFKEGLAKWVQDHDKSVTEIKRQVEDLERDYTASIDKINKSYTDSQTDMNISHARRVEDLQREINEEVALGIWGDKTRIRDLQLRLKRENEDYARSSEKNKETMEDQTKTEMKSTVTKLTKLKEELEEEYKLRKLYDDMFNAFKISEVKVLTDVQTKYRSYMETIAELETAYNELEDNKLPPIPDGTIDSVTTLSEEYKEANTSIGLTLATIVAGLATMKLAINAIKAVFATLAISQVGFTAATVSLFGKARLAVLAFATAFLSLPAVIAEGIIAIGLAYDAGKNLNTELDNLNQTVVSGTLLQSDYITSLKKMREAGKITTDEYRTRLNQLMQENDAFNQSLIGVNQSLSATGFLGGGLSNLWGFLSGQQSLSQTFGNPFRASGGDVSANNPYIVGEQGPELFVPSSSGTIMPNGATTTININNPTVRSDADITAIAQQVSSVLSRETYYKRFK